ncbi:MAG: hypothetical protein QXG39_05570 [Candidatus Aenigmatarchaeota archaeon]
MKTKVVSCRVPFAIAVLLGQICKAHINVADFVRDAIREKIQRDYPDLFKELRVQILEEGSDCGQI